MPLSLARLETTTPPLAAKSLWDAGGRPLVARLLLICLVVVASGPAESGLTADVLALDSALVEVELLLTDAHFVTAIGVGESTDRWSMELPASSAVLERRARLHVLIATAQVALGRDDRAKDALSLAVSLDPELVLAVPNTSPKLVRIFREVRSIELEIEELERELQREERELAREQRAQQNEEGGNLQ